MVYLENCTLRFVICANLHFFYIFSTLSYLVCQNFPPREKLCVCPLIDYRARTNQNARIIWVIIKYYFDEVAGIFMKHS